MDGFEGYVGIPLWDGQQVDDVVFALLCGLSFCFALVFRGHYRLFVKMLRDVVYVKERQSIFETRDGNEAFFRTFMTSQALFLCALCLFSIARIQGYLNHMNDRIILISIVLIFFMLVLFYQFKQAFYYLFGLVFTDPAKYKFWKTGYNAIMGTWGISLYLPALWLAFVGEHVEIPMVLFMVFYILCRIVIIYKTIRIFQRKSNGFLYISLYLCGQELMPLIMLYKGVDYLYNFIESGTLWH